MDRRTQKAQRQEDQETHESPCEESNDDGRRVASRDLAVVETGEVEEPEVGPGVAGGFRGTLGKALDHLGVGFGEGPPVGEGRGELRGGVDTGLIREVEIGGATQDGGLAPARVVEGHAGQAPLDLGRQGLHGLRVRLESVGIGRGEDGGIDRLADLHQDTRAEALPILEDETERDDGEPGLGVARQGPERDAGGAGLELLQIGLVVTDALGEEGDRSTLAEDLETASEHLDVARRIGAGIHTAIDGYGAGEADEEARRHVAPQSALGEHPDPRRQPTDGERRIDQPVEVVADIEARAVAGESLGADHLDPTEEHTEDQSGQGAQQEVDRSAQHDDGERSVCPGNVVAAGLAA